MKTESLYRELWESIGTKVKNTQLMVDDETPLLYKKQQVRILTAKACKQELGTELIFNPLAENTMAVKPSATLDLLIREATIATAIKMTEVFKNVMSVAIHPELHADLNPKAFEIISKTPKIARNKTIKS